jgi:hypothetical protein
MIGNGLIHDTFLKVVLAWEKPLKSLFKYFYLMRSFSEGAL